MASTASTTSSTSRRSSSPLTRYYLAAYNAISFTLWATCTVRGVALLSLSALSAPAGADKLPDIFNAVYSPFLTTTQSLALLEILHSLLGIVRAPVTTTAMQVASRIFLVWGVMYPFRGSIVGDGKETKLGNLAFLGCLAAWGVTECIRYGFFALQVLGVHVPSWWMWLRLI